MSPDPLHVPLVACLRHRNDGGRAVASLGDARFLSSESVLNAFCSA
jgi:hypothetical protein